MGIRKVFRIQQEKYFPLPDYELSTQNQVGVVVYTEKEFYLSLLEFLCQKYSATLEREVDCGTDPDIS